MNTLNTIVTALVDIIKDKSLKLNSASNQEQLRTLYNEASNIHWGQGGVQRRIRFSKNEKKRARLFKEINQCNENLRRTWTQVDAATPFLDSWKRNNKEPLLKVKEFAGCLHSALLKCWQCQCCAAHDTLLRIENRQTQISRKARDTVHFELLFVSNAAVGAAGDSSAWKQMQVVVLPKSTRSSAVLWSPLDPNIEPILPGILEPRNSGSASSMTRSTPGGLVSNFNLDSSEEIDYQNLKAINTICEVLNSPQSIHECFGFVVDEARRLKGTFEAPKWHKSFPSEILNLGDLLKRISGPTLSVVPTSSTTLFKLERITLAVNLASSLLQLHASPWFNERWNKSEILFLSDRSNPSTRPVDIERPLLAHNGITSPTPRNSLPTPTHPNVSVLCLGIMLLELWFAEPIESRRIPSDLVNGIPNSSTDLIVAERWVKENGNLENMPAGYFQAVSSCIFCFFSPMPINKSLENPDFREAIWQNVVVPLEKELQT
ncbi:hypothetical protein BOTCAL_0257g00020 [Botryotinia calthae]|uniref:DUF7580 domain-containing protein n=1 Tax=Botryotinia calthae TaxID=38488 RepID=A0A4Y8CZ27_9HELO|nr:hypothetical protein BOTCAL_0257g00020 [Botryotinia calthae]